MSAAFAVTLASNAMKCFDRVRFSFLLALLMSSRRAANAVRGYCHIVAMWIKGPQCRWEIDRLLQSKRTGGQGDSDDPWCKGSADSFFPRENTSHQDYIVQKGQSCVLFTHSTMKAREEQAKNFKRIR